MIKVDNEMAGFVLVNQICTSENSQWNMGEFFVLARFQGCGIGKKIASMVWDQHPGVWEVSVIPENKPALSFWERTISDYMLGNFTKEIKMVDFDHDQPKRIIFTFNT